MNLATAEGWAHFTNGQKMETFFSAASAVALLRIPGPEPKELTLLAAGGRKEAGDAVPAAVAR